MRVIIFGAGTLGAVVADVVRDCGHTVVGFVDNDESLAGREVEPGGARVLYDDDDFFETLDEEQDFDAVALAIADEKVRMRLFFELGEEVLLPPFVHPHASVSSHATIGMATIVMPRAVVETNVTVGRAALIGALAYVGSGAKIGDAVTIGAGTRLGHLVTIGERVHIDNGCTLGNEVAVGADSILRPGTTLRRGVGEGVRLGPPAATTLGA